MLTQPDFPAHRRRDPLRLAELQAYTQFMNSDRPGRVLYEVKTSRNIPELDFAVLIEGTAVYGVQIKGGQHAIQRGQWQRFTDNGPVNIPCPMKITWDASLQIRDVVKRQRGRKIYAVAVLVFPDMEPDPDIELRAENDRVKVLFGTHSLVLQSRLSSRCLKASPVVTLHGPGLVPPSPSRPVDGQGRTATGQPQQPAQQPSDLGHGQWDEFSHEPIPLLPSPPAA